MARWLIVFLVLMVGVFEARVRPSAAIVTWFLAATMSAFFLAIPSANSVPSAARLLTASALWIVAVGAIGYWYKKHRA
jgi:hypothetical protein